MTARTTGNESWDSFWAEVSGARTEMIRGIEVKVPRDIPIGFEERVQELSASSAREDVAELVTNLFGDDVVAAWDEAGMGYNELITILTWGIAQATGTDMTFAEAYQAVQESGTEGKAPNRQARRAASKPRSAATGGRSARTSAASTASARKSSRG